MFRFGFGYYGSWCFLIFVGCNDPSLFGRGMHNLVFVICPWIRQSHQIPCTVAPSSVLGLGLLRFCFEPAVEVGVNE